MHFSRRRFGTISLAALAAGCAPQARTPDLLIHGGPITDGGTRKGDILLFRLLRSPARPEG